MNDLGENGKVNIVNSMSEEMKQHEIHVVQYGFSDG